MSKGCEMCNRTGVVFKPGMPGLDDKDTCPECGGRGIVESATVPAGERDATADLAMLNKACRGCGGTGILRSPVAEGECGNCDGTGIAYPDEDMVALAEYWIERAERSEADNEELRSKMSADLIAMEGTIKELRHELDRSRNAHGKAELEVARLKGQYADEVAEFNTGYQAAKDGLPESAEPERCPHDVWMCGYAWGKFEALKAEVEHLREANVFALSENARMKNALEEIEQVGHNPAHLACDLMDENPGMEERLWALVNRLADMANQQVSIAHTSRKALYCNEGPQGSNWFDVMARLRHAILPEINADSTFFTIGQVRTLVAEIEKLESLVAEANSELAGVTDIYRRAYTAIGACDISNFLAKCEQAAGFEQLEHDLEGTIKDLRFALANHAQFQRGIECQFCRLAFELGTPDDVLTQHAMTCEKSPVVQENARLHKIIADATGHSKDGDGVDLLCKALYGRPGQVPDWLGGSEARMLYDAVEEIEELRSEADALDRLRGWRDAAPGRWFNLENDIGCPEALALGELPDAAHLPSRLVVIGCDDEPHTEDNPASFTEVVEAALARWSDLYGEEQP